MITSNTKFDHYIGNTPTGMSKHMAIIYERMAARCKDQATSKYHANNQQACRTTNIKVGAGTKTKTLHSRDFNEIYAILASSDSFKPTKQENHLRSNRKRTFVFEYIKWVRLQSGPEPGPHAGPYGPI